jgi:hypothetical protein
VKADGVRKKQLQECFGTEPAAGGTMVASPRAPCNAPAVRDT